MNLSDTLDLTTSGEREFVISRTFDAPRHLVFKAWTDPTFPPRWMLGPEGWTMPVCEIDLRVGGEWHFVWRKSDGTEMAMRGTYKEIVPPERLVSTESWGPNWPETINTPTLSSLLPKRGVLDQSIQSRSKLARTLGCLLALDCTRQSSDSKTCL